MLSTAPWPPALAPLSPPSSSSPAIPSPWRHPPACIPPWRPEKLQISAPAPLLSTAQQRSPPVENQPAFLPPASRFCSLHTSSLRGALAAARPDHISMAEQPPCSEFLLFPRCAAPRRNAAVPVATTSKFLRPALRSKSSSPTQRPLSHGRPDFSQCPVHLPPSSSPCAASFPHGREPPPFGRHPPLCSSLHVRRQPICAASNTLAGSSSRLARRSSAKSPV